MPSNAFDSAAVNGGSSSGARAGGRGGGFFAHATRRTRTGSRRRIRHFFFGGRVPNAMVRIEVFELERSRTDSVRCGSSAKRVAWPRTSSPPFLHVMVSTSLRTLLSTPVMSEATQDQPSIVPRGVSPTLRTSTRAPGVSRTIHSPMGLIPSSSASDGLNAADAAVVVDSLTTTESSAASEDGAGALFEQAATQRAKEAKPIKVRIRPGYPDMRGKSDV